MFAENGANEQLDRPIEMDVDEARDAILMENLLRSNSSNIAKAQTEPVPDRESELKISVRKP